MKIAYFKNGDRIHYICFLPDHDSLVHTLTWKCITISSLNQWYFKTPNLTLSMAVSFKLLFVPEIELQRSRGILCMSSPFMMAKWCILMTVLTRLNIVTKILMLPFLKPIRITKRNLPILSPNFEICYLHLSPFFYSISNFEICYLHLSISKIKV